MTTFDVSVAIKLFPEMKVSFIVASANPTIPAGQEDASARVMSRMEKVYGSTEPLLDHPLTEGYREFYTGMNVRPSSASTPIKQALRVFQRGYRAIHPVVDISMEIEYVTLCSFQVYDWESFGEKIQYHAASGAEELPERAHGTGRCKIRQGELLLLDEKGVVNSPSCGNAASRVVKEDSNSELQRKLLC